MARILFINSVCIGSTGTICKNLYKAAERNGHICCIAYWRGQAPNEFNTIRVGNKIDFYLHVLKARLFDASGFGSKFATRQLIKEIDRFKPDVIHLHNLHGYYLNIGILFTYLKAHPEIKKIWTLHDCWAFTGHCAYYTYANCENWCNGCTGRCPNKKEYPKTFLSNIRSNYKNKNKLFKNVDNMILVTPSKWLKKEVEKSFLNEYETVVINNGIDTNVFKYTKSNLKKVYNIEDKKIILGVASVWDKRKGLDTFLELSKFLDQEYQIVLIGLTTKQISKLPSNIIGINRTENVQELVKWYSTADIYFNPTLEDNYPTTNLEAVACGTPIITFNTGGSPESAFATENEIIFSRTVAECIEKIKGNTNIRKNNLNIDIKYMIYEYLINYFGEVVFHD